LRPSASAAQLRANGGPAMISTPMPTSPEIARNRSGIGPVARGPPNAGAGTALPPILKRSTSTMTTTDPRTLALALALAEEPEEYLGPSIRYAQFAEPALEVSAGAAAGGGGGVLASTGRRLPFHLLSKTFMGTEHPPAVAARGHRRGSSATSMR
jgi:hypothetical protein